MAGISPFGASPTGAVADLGFGGGLLQNQVKDETEEQRRKRLQALGLSGGMMDPKMGAAATTLFGLGGGTASGARSY